MPTLEEELRHLDPDLRERLARGSFRDSFLLDLAASLRQGSADERRRTRNVVKGEVSAPRPGEVKKLPTDEATVARLRERGQAAMARGELAFCTMAGGMATRMGGIVKALAEVFGGKTFLDLRLRENESASKKAGRPVPLWFMTSEATDQELRHALTTVGVPDHVAVFQQNLSMRLTPEGALFHDADGKPSVHATGHGDLVDGLRRSGLLESFVGRGGKWVWLTNVDNLGASVDPVVLGSLIEAFEAGGEDAPVVQCEVCRKEGDKGGIPVHAEGRLQVLEEFRLPADFDARTVDVFNTNTFLVRAESLLTTPLSWTYFEVEKKVDGRPAIQFERLLQEITAQMPTSYLEVPRDGVASRFLPVKDFEELARRRETIEVVARARGMV